MSAECYIILTCIYHQEEDGRWTAECEELGTATYGDTFEKTKTALEESIGLHLNTLEAVGERERFFKENGIKIIRKTPRKTNINLPPNPNLFVQRYTHPVESCVC